MYVSSELPLLTGKCGGYGVVAVSDDGKARCPSCLDALTTLEEIDDDLESTGYIEVVQTDDRNVARSANVHTYPALIYYRRRSPILYDGIALFAHFDDEHISIYR